MHFNNKNIDPGQIEIKIGNCRIKSSDKVRFLGLIIDYKLAFTAHIAYIEQKCTRALNIIRYLSGISWGADPTTLITLYKSYVRSLLDYGSFIFFPRQKRHKQKLEGIQYTAIRAALGYRRSTPTNILLAESKLTLLEKRSECLCKCLVLKSLSNIKNSSNEAILRYHSDLRRPSIPKSKIPIVRDCIRQIVDSNIFSRTAMDIFSYDYRILTANITTEETFGTKLAKSDDPNKEIDNLLKNHNACGVYTDGSKSENSRSVGSAFVCPTLSIQGKTSISRQASIFTAECLAMSNALDIPLSRPNQNYIIFTDSRSLVQSLNIRRITVTTNPHIINIRKKLVEFQDRQTKFFIEIYWIPAHIGIQGNEMADNLAKDATKEEAEDTIAIPYTDFYALFKKNAVTQTNREIKEQGDYKGRKYFNLYYEESSKPWFTNKKLNRYCIVKVNRCRADHYNLMASLARIKVVDSPQCTCGNGPQDINHVLWQCRLYDEERKELVDKLHKQLPLNIESLIAKPDITACKHICNFLENCKLNI